MLVHQNRAFSVPAFRSNKCTDPTGAGDTFAGGFMGYLASVNHTSDPELRRAMVYGSVMGSFTGKIRVDRLRTLKRAENPCPGAPFLQNDPVHAIGRVPDAGFSIDPVGN